MRGEVHGLSPVFFPREMAAGDSNQAETQQRDCAHFWHRAGQELRIKIHAVIGFDVAEVYLNRFRTYLESDATEVCGDIKIDQRHRAWGVKVQVDEIQSKTISKLAKKVEVDTEAITINVKGEGIAVLLRVASSVLDNKWCIQAESLDSLYSIKAASICIDRIACDGRSRGRSADDRDGCRSNVQ